MHVRLVAALALATAFSFSAQALAQATAAASPDFSTANPVAGSWHFSSSNGVSAATFTTVAAQPQLVFSCTIAARQITISKPEPRAAPSMSIWTTAETRNLPTSFLPATGRLNAQLSAYDPFLDAIAFSRGRIAVSVAGQPSLVVPVWPEVTRVIEDCRA